MLKIAQMNDLARLRRWRAVTRVTENHMHSCASSSYIVQLQVHHHCKGVSCGGLVMPGATAWLYAPYQILLLRNMKNTCIWNAL